MIPRSHPRYISLKTRERLIEGLEKGITARAGLIAHGRGEAFDYLIGERTLPVAMKATRAAVAMLLLAERPVLSVNGNAAALVPREIVQLGKVTGAPLEVNLFYRIEERVRKIREELLRHGADSVLTGNKAMLKSIKHARAKVHPSGIYSADVVFVPLEDGDRTEALVKMHKKVIAVDLNPLSRTSRAATITIVDNITRAVPNMVALAGEMKKMDRRSLERVANRFDNQKNLQEVLQWIKESGNLKG